MHGKPLAGSCSDARQAERLPGRMSDLLEDAEDRTEAHATPRGFGVEVSAFEPSRAPFASGVEVDDTSAASAALHEPTGRVSGPRGRAIRSRVDLEGRRAVNSDPKLVHARLGDDERALEHDVCHDV